MSRQKVRAAIKFLIMGVWVAITGIAVFSGGVRSPIVVVYPVVILMSGWLDTSRNAKAIAALSVASAIGLYLGEHFGWLPRQFPAPATVFLAHQVLIYLLSAVMVVFV